MRPVDDVRGRGRDPVVDGRRRLRENGLLLDVGWRRLVSIDGLTVVGEGRGGGMTLDGLGLGVNGLMGRLVGVNGRGLDEDGLSRGLVGVGYGVLGLVVDGLLRVADGKLGLGVHGMVGVGMLCVHRLRDGLRLSEDGLGLSVDGVARVGRDRWRLV